MDVVLHFRVTTVGAYTAAQEILTTMTESPLVAQERVDVECAIYQIVSRGSFCVALNDRCCDSESLREASRSDVTRFDSMEAAT